MDRLYSPPPLLTALVALAVAASAASARPTSAKATGAEPLVGKVVGVDPGHNGRNYTDPAYINHPIWNGREQEACDTTGTETDSGYTEARFNFNVARYLTADLKAQGARVVLTRHSNDGVGPCVTRRAQIFNRAHVNVAISIHADGGPVGGRGFAVLEPVADSINSPFDRRLASLRADSARQLPHRHRDAGQHLRRDRRSAAARRPRRREPQSQPVRAD